MKTTSICYYNPEPKENEITCGRCGKHIKYTHIIIDNAGNEIGMGNCCIMKLRKAGEITDRLPRRGRYDWKMSDVREDAYWKWYCASLTHAE